MNNQTTVLMGIKVKVPVPTHIKAPGHRGAWAKGFVGGLMRSHFESPYIECEFEYISGWSYSFHHTWFDGHDYGITRFGATNRALSIVDNRIKINKIKGMPVIEVPESCLDWLTGKLPATPTLTTVTIDVPKAATYPCRAAYAHGRLAYAMGLSKHINPYTGNQAKYWLNGYEFEGGGCDGHTPDWYPHTLQP